MNLLPCPFCGGKAEIERYGTSRVSTLYTCNSCSCSLETGEEWDHGADWNKRTYLEEIEALHKIIDAYGEDEGFVPIRVVELYDKYHRPWEKENLPKLYEE